jgi:Zn-dependent M28 family amino/carboxypeptidase
MKLVALWLAMTAACLGPAPSPAATFDGQRAFEHVKELVRIGPRVAGSPGAERARDYIRTELERVGLRVEAQPFDAATPLGTVRMVNLRALVGSTAATGRIIIAGHYDTKRFDDFAFVGANDGGSSAGFLIEMSRVLATGTHPRPIELLFLDGEEAVVEWEGDDNTYGSRHYVRQAKEAGTLGDIHAMVLVDMIGDRDLHLKRESQSTPWLTDVIWRAAKSARRPEFVDESTPINDDHLRFLEAGVAATDLIDLDYPWWHQPGDTLDKIAPKSLQAVGDVLLRALPDIAKHAK